MGVQPGAAPRLWEEREEGRQKAEPTLRGEEPWAGDQGARLPKAGALCTDE